MPVGQSRIPSIKVVISSRYDTPVASQALEYMEMGVKPGKVLISLTITVPSSVTKVSTRESPSPSTAVKARAATRRTYCRVSWGSLAGTSTWEAEESMYLLSKS